MKTMKNIPYRLQQNKVPEIRALWGEAFCLEVQMLTVGAPYFSRKIDPAPLQKMARTPMRMRAINFTVKYVVHAGPPIHRQFTNFPENQLTTVYAFI